METLLGHFTRPRWVIHLIEFIQQNAMLQRGERAASVNRAPPCTPQLMSYLERRRPELMLVAVHVNGQRPRRALQDDDSGCGTGCHGHRGGIGGGYEQPSPEIWHAGKSFLPARHTGSGAQPYLEGIGIRSHRTRGEPGIDVLPLQEIAADCYAR